MEQEDPDKVFVNWRPSTQNKPNSDSNKYEAEDDNIDE